MELIADFSQYRIRKGKECPCAEIIKHYAMKAYGGVDA
jgi:hypothetical protein